MAVPVVSVVVPAYNNARTLRETMQSILSEDVDGLEVIVADHASVDATRAVMAEFGGDPRVTLLDTPAGGGAGRNWNRVTDAATGTFIKLVCGDDVLRPGILRRQSAILESSGAVLTACRRDIIAEDGRVLVAGWGLRGIGRAMPGAQAVRTAARAGSNLFGEPASVMMRRSDLVAAGGWNDAFPYLIDQATYSAVLMRGSFAPDDATGATFRLSAGQWSVALLGDQARQARAFHRWLAARHPEVLSRSDRIRADLRATMMAQARRVSYRLLQRRNG